MSTELLRSVTTILHKRGMPLAVVGLGIRTIQRSAAPRRPLSRIEAVVAQGSIVRIHVSRGRPPVAIPRHALQRATSKGARDTRRAFKGPFRGDAKPRWPTRFLYRHRSRSRLRRLRRCVNLRPGRETDRRRAHRVRQLDSALAHLSGHLRRAPPARTAL